MSDITTQNAVRATLLHYAQLEAQNARERAKSYGMDLFANEQCRKCGLYHASEPCHPYAIRVLNREY
jgi:hypothetical protein